MSRSRLHQLWVNCCFSSPVLWMSGIHILAWLSISDSQLCREMGSSAATDINNNNNNNNNRISIAPYGRNFRGAGGRSDQCSAKVWLNRKVLSLDLKTVRESLMRTVCGSELQTDGAENRKARLEKSVLMNGLSSSGMAAERKVRLQVRSAIRRCR